jgi:hypothetical protein
MLMFGFYLPCPVLLSISSIPDAIFKARTFGVRGTKTDKQHAYNHPN